MRVGPNHQSTTGRLSMSGSAQGAARAQSAGPRRTSDGSQPV